MSVSSLFSWFWQPPLEGQPGLMMIVDDHPGPQAPGVAFIGEDIVEVLQDLESKIPTDVNLFQLRIYARNIFGLWVQLEANIVSRQIHKKAPEFTQGELDRLWEAREEAPAGSSRTLVIDAGGSA